AFNTKKAQLLRRQLEHALAHFAITAVAFVSERGEYHGVVRWRGSVCKHPKILDSLQSSTGRRHVIPLPRRLPASESLTRCRSRFFFHFLVAAGRSRQRYQQLLAQAGFQFCGNGRIVLEELTGVLLALADAVSTVPIPEIGRASCRERVQGPVGGVAAWKNGLVGAPV